MSDASLEIVVSPAMTLELYPHDAPVLQLSDIEVILEAHYDSEFAIEVNSNIGPRGETGPEGPTGPMGPSSDDVFNDAPDFTLLFDNGLV